MGWKTELLEGLREILNEETTDKLIAKLDEAIDIPGPIPDGIVWKVLDQMLPGAFIDVLEKILDEEESEVDA